jgi:hypothetical protein
LGDLNFCNRGVLEIFAFAEGFADFCLPKKLQICSGELSESSEWIDCKFGLGWAVLLKARRKVKSYWAPV